MNQFHAFFWEGYCQTFCDSQIPIDVFDFWIFFLNCLARCFVIRVNKPGVRDLLLETNIRIRRS